MMDAGRTCTERPGRESMRIWQRWHNLRWWWRWPIKWAVVGVVAFAIVFPNPRVFLRHVDHWRDPNALIDPHLPELQPLVVELKSALDPSLPPRKALARVQLFVESKIPYAWDWDTWGSGDYLPTLKEALAMGREDCDGRAVVAASLLRNIGYEAELVTDLTHMWVKTDRGETMGPPRDRRKSVEGTKDGLRIHWDTIANLPRAMAYGAAVFPWPREMVLILAVWLMTLGRGWGVVRAVIVLGLLTAGLWCLRRGGASPYDPIVWLQLAALLHFFVAVVVAAMPALRAAWSHPPGLATASGCAAPSAD